jgi:hypothetical protein
MPAGNLRQKKYLGIESIWEEKVVGNRKYLGEGSIWERKKNLEKRKSKCASMPPSSLRIPDILPPHASIT